MFQGGFTKNQDIGGNCLKREAWAVCKFRGGGGGRGGLSKKEEGADAPMHAMTCPKLFSATLCFMLIILV